MEVQPKDMDKLMRDLNYNTIVRVIALAGEIKALEGKTIKEVALVEPKDIPEEVKGLGFPITMPVALIKTNKEERYINIQKYLTDMFLLPFKESEDICKEIFKRLGEKQFGKERTEKLIRIAESGKKHA